MRKNVANASMKYSILDRDPQTAETGVPTPREASCCVLVVFSLTAEDCLDQSELGQQTTRPITPKRGKKEAC